MIAFIFGSGSASSSATPNIRVPLVRLTSSIFWANHYQTHCIQNYNDLDRLNQFLTSLHLIRTLDSEQLPSQAVSSASLTPASANIEQETESGELKHENTEPLLASQDTLRECSGELSLELLKMAINQGYFAFEVQVKNHEVAFHTRSKANQTR